MFTRKAGVFYVACYIGTIFLANWLVTTRGIVPIGFGLLAPAGVYAAGLALTMRDFTQRSLGRAWVLLAIVVGAGLSALLSPTLALASAIAFLVSELADFLIYTPIEGRNWPLAVFLSNVVGAAIDSALFLYLAFRSLDFFRGQFVGKFYMTLAAMALLWGLRRSGFLPWHTSRNLARGGDDPAVR